MMGEKDTKKEPYKAKENVALLGTNAQSSVIDVVERTYL